ncbi:MAG: AAA family ATPase [Hyphomicrobium sp.]|jgi:ATP-dependent Zn protease
MTYASVTAPTKMGIHLYDLAGMAEARAWGEALASDIALFRKRGMQWSDIDPGCMLHGPPGTGKTTYARALAASCDLPLIATNFSEWQSAGEGHLGSMIDAMRKTFQTAMQNAPCILFIDELDSIPTRGAGPHQDYWNAAVNALLKAFDDISRIQVIVVAACNHPEKIDPALVRSGRLDRKIAIPLPSIKDLEDIIRFHLTDFERRILGYPDNYTLASAAVLCAGMSGADVAKLLRNARRLARQGDGRLTLKHYVAALDANGASLDAEARHRVAVHEAGHAVAALRLAVSQNITASLVMRGESHGSVHLEPGQQPLTRDKLKDLIVVALAGRAAEDVQFGKPSAMAGGSDTRSDLARANRLAADAVLRFGFSEQVGLLWHNGSQQESPFFASSPIAKEVKALLDAAYARALDIVRADLEIVRAVAAALIERRALAHDDLVALVHPSSGSKNLRIGVHGIVRAFNTALYPPKPSSPVEAQKMRPIPARYRLPATAETSRSKDRK